MATSRTIALPVSVLRKSRTGAARLRAHAVRPVCTVACAVAIGVQIDKPRKRDRCGPMAPVTIRAARPEDAAAVAAIYNDGIAGRQATFETRPRAPSGDRATGSSAGCRSSSPRMATAASWASRA